MRCAGLVDDTPAVGLTLQPTAASLQHTEDSHDGGDSGQCSSTAALAVVAGLAPAQITHDADEDGNAEQSSSTAAQDERRNFNICAVGLAPAQRAEDALGSGDAVAWHEHLQVVLQE